MRAKMQRRHKLSHNQGMVDQSYVDQSGDDSYAVGQTRHQGTSRKGALRPSLRNLPKDFEKP